MRKDAISMPYQMYLMVTNNRVWGGYKTGGGSEVLPVQKGGWQKSFSHAEGGHKMFWSRFYMIA